MEICPSSGTASDRPVHTEDILVLDGDMQEKGRDSWLFCGRSWSSPAPTRSTQSAATATVLVSNFFETDRLDERFFATISPSTRRASSASWRMRWVMWIGGISPAARRPAGALSGDPRLAGRTAPHSGDGAPGVRPRGRPLPGAHGDPGPVEVHENDDFRDRDTPSPSTSLWDTGR